MISEKYLAGFLDADGYLGVRARIGACPDLEVGVAQLNKGAVVLEALRDMFGGVIVDDGVYSKLSMRGGPARKCFERLKKYLVLKQDHAERMLELIDTSGVLRTRDDVLAVRERVREIRNYGATQQPNFPSRKWMAGYIDGDGSFSVKVCRKTGYAYPTLSILAARNYIVGVHLLEKAFGGILTPRKQNLVWQIQLSDPSKCKEVVGHCAQHLVLKQAQAYFLLGCAANGNFRDGITIRETIKTLNSQQHRLSDPASVAAEYLRQVRSDIPKRRQGRPPGVKETKPRAKRQSKPLKCG
jgi:hypothetical protein